MFCGLQRFGSVLLMIEILHYLIRALNYGKYGIFLIMRIADFFLLWVGDSACLLSDSLPGLRV